MDEKIWFALIKIFESQNIFAQEFTQLSHFKSIAS